MTNTLSRASRRYRWLRYSDTRYRARRSPLAIRTRNSSHGWCDAQTPRETNMKTDTRMLFTGFVWALAVLAAMPVLAEGKKLNIITIISDDFGYGDAGPYGGGEGRGMPTPNLDRIAKEGQTFFSFYAQPSCTPGRAAMLTGRFPN